MSFSFSASSTTTSSASSLLPLQPTGSFVHESSLSAGRRYNSHPPHPLHALASHCVRTSMGEHVQWVVDGLQAMGASSGGVTLSALLEFLQRQQQKVTTTIHSLINGQGQSQFASTTTSSKKNQKNDSLEHATVRAALFVLLQHSIVSVVRQRPPLGSSKKGQPLSSPLQYHYRYHPDRAAHLSGTRYARYVEFTKRVALQDPIAASVVETLLLHGRLRTIDLVVTTVAQQQQQLQQQEQDPDNNNHSNTSSTTHAHHKYTARETIVDAMTKLVRGGYLERVPSMEVPTNGNTKKDQEEDPDEGEFEFGNGDNDKSLTKKNSNKRSTSQGSILRHGSQGSNTPPTKRVRLSLGDEAKSSSAGRRQASGGGRSSSNTDTNNHGEDPAVVELLQSNAQYKATLPIDAVWRVNETMFHDSILALRLGRLVAELYNHKVRWAGSLVTGALKYKAHLDHTTTVPSTDTAFFIPRNVIKYLPKTVVQNLESEATSGAAVPQSVGSSSNNNKRGGGSDSVEAVLHRAFCDLARQTHPAAAVRRVGDDAFEIATSSLLDYLRRRVVHQVVHDRHGTVAARIMEILQHQGWLESDTLANAAMVPAKDTRGLLHELYRSRYVDLFPLSNSGGGGGSGSSSNSSLYLWCVHTERLRRKVLDDTYLAVRNLQLRRQHESEVVGREWIERAHQRTTTTEEENEHDADKLRYQQFCLGLERLDVALHQLDETLLILSA